MSGVELEQVRRCPCAIPLGTVVEFEKEYTLRGVEDENTLRGDIRYVLKEKTPALCLYLQKSCEQDGMLLKVARSSSGFYCLKLDKTEDELAKMRK